MNTNGKGVLSSDELSEARRGLLLMLRRKRFSPRWIEAHLDDLLAQACSEYAAKLAEGEAPARPIGWLIHCAWRRAQDLLDSQRRKPEPSSLEAAFHLADESSPTPEQEVQALERAERLQRALRHLPKKECEMLALVYFEEHSVREAGRKVGWRKSVADRHHKAAMEKLRALLGAERSMLSPASLGLGAWIVAQGEGRGRLIAVADTLLAPARMALAVATEIAAAVVQRTLEIARRALPFADPSSAATLGGGGRALGACGVAAATLLCGVAASGVVGALPMHRQAKQPSASRPAPKPKRASAPEKPTLPSSPSLAQGNEPQGVASRAAPAVKLKLAKSAHPAVAPRHARTASPSPSPASAAQTSSEFGVEASAGPADIDAASLGSPAAPPAYPAAHPATPAGNSGSAARSASGAEFGL